MEAWHRAAFDAGLSNGSSSSGSSLPSGDGVDDWVVVRIYEDLASVFELHHT